MVFISTYWDLTGRFGTFSASISSKLFLWSRFSYANHSPFWDAYEKRVWRESFIFFLVSFEYAASLKKWRIQRLDIRQRSSRRIRDGYLWPKPFFKGFGELGGVTTPLSDMQPGPRETRESPYYFAR